MSAVLLKYTLDYFYDGSKHNESITDCNSCHVHNFLFSVAYYGIRSILWLYSAQCLLVREKKTADASLLNVKIASFCNGLTLSERKISTATSPQKIEFIFNLLILAADPGGVSSLPT